MVRDKLKKFNIKVILLVLFGFGLIFIGVCGGNGEGREGV